MSSSLPWKILVVGAQSNARKALAALLDEEGFDVDTANDADEALSKLATFRPAVAIADLELRGIDAVELVAMMRSNSDPPSVIAMAAYGDTRRGLSALRAGATDYLSKPIRFDTLLAMLAKALLTSSEHA
jgi:DNA-binding response OmpR family regulator